MKSKNILILVNHDIVIYNFRKELVQCLLRNGYNVWISSPSGERINTLIKMGCNYVETNIERHGMNPFRDLQLFYTYARMINYIRPFIILTYTIKPNIYGSLASYVRHTPCIVNITGLGQTMEGNTVKKKVVIALYKLALKHVRCIFFQNEANKRVFEELNICHGNTKILPGSGVNLEEFSVFPYPPPDTIEFAFIGRVMRDKGINEFLSAAKVISKQYNNVRFHVCGFCEENYENILLDLEKNGIIVYHRMVEDIREILRLVHCTVLPSYHEGMANSLLETAASGRPIIASDIPGCRETLDDGVTGFKFKVKEVQDLIAVIKKFVELPYQSKVDMGLRARAKMEREFDRKIVIRNYMEEIQREDKRKEV